MRKLVDRLAEMTRRNSFRFGLIGVLALVVTLVAAHPALAANANLGPLDKILSWFAAIAMALVEVIGLLVIAVLDVVIPVMQYQGFTTSPVVVAGWAITRDVVNMFFVVVLIVIAMGTIFGHSRFQWKQQVPKLMIFALVINFSKTLCGLMIDFAQVVMITFANALKDIAGGNFIQLLGLGDMFSLSENAAAIKASASGTGPGGSAFDWFAASVAAVLMMVWVLAVVVMLLFILIYRVVMLWILIVLAPLAWFMGGQSVFKSDAYGEWWKNFVCYTAIGPVITFFLWLTLAVAGSGFIAANDPGLSSVAPAGDLNSNASGFVNKIFEWQRLTSFVVGMAMLMVGFDAASKICSGVKGPGFQAMLSAGKGVPGKIGSYVGGAARKYGGKGLAAGYAGGKGLAVGTGALAAGLATTVGAQGVGWKDRMQAIAPTRAGQAARADLLRKGSKRMPGALSGVSRSMAMGADERQAELAETMKKKAEEKYKGASSETKVDTLIRLANGDKHQFENAENMGLLAEALKNQKMREKLDAAGVLGTLTREQLPELKRQLKGTKDYEAIDEFEAGRPDLTGNFVGINTEDDLKKLDPSALARLKGNAAFRAQLSTFKTSVRNAAGSDNLSGLEFLDQRHGNAKQVRAWENGMTGVYEGMGNLTLAMVPDEEIAAHASESLVRRHATVTGRPDSAAKAVASHRSVGTRERMNSNAALRQEVNTRAFGATYTGGAITGVDRAKTKKAVKNDVFAAKNVATADLTGDMSSAIADAYNDKHVLENLVDQYMVSDADGKREMDASVLSNVFESFGREEAEARRSGDTAREAMFASQRAALATELEAVRGGNANMVAEIMGHLTDLAAEQTRLSGLPRPTAEDRRALDRVTDDITRLRSRRRLH